MKKPFTHFDLPTYSLDGEHHIPARARTSEEIERRRSMPAGSLLLEEQRNGLQVASRVLQELEDDGDLQFMSEILAVSGLNTSWYTFADQEVMRRRLYLPERANDETGLRQSRESLVQNVRANLSVCAELASQIFAEHTTRRITKRTQAGLGRAIGTASLGLAVVHLGDAPESVSAHQIQDATRRASLKALHRSRTMVSETGTIPSMAGFSDPDSDISVYVRRNAPNQTRTLFIHTQEEVLHENAA